MRGSTMVMHQVESILTTKPCLVKLRDFAYLAFTVGMTFQVSDTVSRHISFGRAATKGQAGTLPYVFGTAIIATTINAVASLSA